MSKTRKHYFVFNLKYPGILCLVGGLAAWDQIRRVKLKIQNSMMPKVWTRQLSAPQFIYIFENKIPEPSLSNEIPGISNELYKVTQFYLWLYGKIKSSKYYEDVFQFHESFAWRFLKLAQDENFQYRQKAVDALAHMPRLSDATCRQIAQACDCRTAAGLARTDGVDFRLLLDSPKSKQIVDRAALINRLHQFLINLDADSNHSCLKKVIYDSFAESDQKGFDDDVGFNETRPDVIAKCTETILHHSWAAENARSIIKNGGIPIIVDIYKYLEQNSENLNLLVIISRILSNLSMQFDCHQELFSQGCFKIFARLLRHSDVRVSVPAGRALLNCDSDAGSQFFRNIYALFPLYRSVPQYTSNADVVFIHGLLGGVFVTWRQRDLSAVLKKGSDDFPVDANVQKDKSHERKFMSELSEDTRSQCWPRDWLAKDCSNIRILGVNYDTNVTMWAPRCPISSQQPSLSDRTTHLIDVLKAAGVGKKPIIWVAHSMGGLLVKDLLTKCSESETELDKSLFEQTKGVVFFSTPHRGSRLAKMNTASQLIVWPTVEVQELRPDSPALLQLHEKFINLIKTHPIKILSFAEREPTFINALKMDLRFVEDESSFIEIGEIYGVPLDHLCVCKPAVKNSFIYQKVLDFIEEIISSVS